MSETPDIPSNKPARGDKAGLIVTVVAATMIVVAVFAESPGLAILAVLMMAPVLVHATVARKSNPAASQGEKRLSKGIEGTSVVAVGFIIVVASAAFFVTCFGVGLAGFLIENAPDSGSNSWVVTAVVAGLFVGSLVLIKMVQWLRPRE